MYGPLSLNVTVTLTFDLGTLNSIGVIYLSWPTTIPSKRSLGYEFFSYWSGKVCLRTLFFEGGIIIKKKTD